MSDKVTIKERLSNRLFAIPAVAQLWAKLSAGRTQGLVDLSGGIPFAKFNKSLTASKVALLTTGGIHLPDQPPFDMTNPDGDATYRAIPGNVALEQITITHKYYDHRDADRDLNVIFPLAHFRDLVAKGILGSLATTHFGFMGHIDAEQVAILNEQTAPQVAAQLRRWR
ncbi:MAG: glycine/sarcosine/betaine reductase selenoprotein B family protein [Caldilineaceae bacterium]